MTYEQLTDGETLEVGDVIKHESALGNRRYKIHRVTAKYAFIKYNDVAEGKYHRVITWAGPRRAKRLQWDTTRYTAWRERRE